MIEGAGGHNNSPDEIDRLLSDAVKEHASGNIQEANDMRTEALSRSDPKDSKFPGILATHAWALSRLGIPVEETLPIAERAASMHRQHLAHGSPADRETTRQQAPITEMVIGSLAVKQGVQFLLGGDAEGGIQVHAGRAHLEQSWTDLLGVNGWRHQHPLNATRRVSIAWSVDGYPLKGLGMAVLAGMYAPLSESPMLLNGTSELSASKRLQAKWKASLGAGAAGAIAVLSAMPGSKPKTMARRLANKVII